MGRLSTTECTYLPTIIRGGGCPPISQKGTAYGSVANVRILAIRLAPIGMGPMRLWPRRLTTFMFFQVDQQRLVDVHVDCLMKTVTSPCCPVPLNYTEEIARVPF